MKCERKSIIVIFIKKISFNIELVPFHFCLLHVILQFGLYLWNECENAKVTVSRLRERRLGSGFLPWSSALSSTIGMFLARPTVRGPVFWLPVPLLPFAAVLIVATHSQLNRLQQDEVHDAIKLNDSSTVTLSWVSNPRLSHGTRTLNQYRHCRFRTEFELTHKTVLWYW